MKSSAGQHTGAAVRDATDLYRTSVQEVRPYTKTEPSEDSRERTALEGDGCTSQTSDKTETDEVFSVHAVQIYVQKT